MDVYLIYETNTAVDSNLVVNTHLISNPIQTITIGLQVNDSYRIKLCA